MEKTITTARGDSLRLRKKNLRSAVLQEDLAALIEILLYESGLAAAVNQPLRLCALLFAMRLASATKQLNAATIRLLSHEYREIMQGKLFADEFQCTDMRQLAFSIDPLLNPFNVRMVFFQDTVGRLIKEWLGQFCAVLGQFIRLNCRSTSPVRKLNLTLRRQAQSENLVRRCFAVMAKISDIACPENPQTLAEEYREFIKGKVAAAFLDAAYRQSVSRRQARGFSSPQGQLQLFCFALMAVLADPACKNELLSFLPALIVAWFYTDDHLKVHVAAFDPPQGKRWSAKRVHSVFPPERLAGIAESIMKHLHETGTGNANYLSFEEFIKKEFKESLTAARQRKKKKTSQP